MQEVNGNLWHFKYPIIAKSGEQLDEYLEVATTRPETLLGDTAVAVNPDDDRYKEFIGVKVKVLSLIEKYLLSLIHMLIKILVLVV